MSPEDVEKVKQHFLQTMAGAAEMVFSEANPYFRAAQRVERGESLDAALSEELYADTDSAEARSWLGAGLQKKQKRFLHTYSPARSKRLIDELYAAGATRVLAAEIQRCGDFETSDVLIVFLSEDKAQRRALAAVHEREMAKVWCFEPRAKIPLPKGDRLLFQYT
jgi:hypothetical protein